MENQTTNTTGKKIKQTFKSIFTNKTVLVSLLITFFFVVFYHLGTMLTLPLVKLPGTYTSPGSFVDMLNLLSAGGLEHMSIFAIGLGPYITSQIIIQLLSSDLIKPLAKMAKAGERGKKKLEIITRILTLPFCFVQAYATLALILSTRSGGGSTGISIITFSGETVTEISQVPGAELFCLMLLLTAGTYIAIFVGDMITKRGVGNGVTTLILVGIVSQIFGSFRNIFSFISEKLSGTNEVTIVLSCILYVIFFVVLLLVVIFINGATRKIPIQQTGQGLIDDKKELPYLPIKLNSAGVIPVIFASSVITIPGTIAQFLPNGEAKWFIEDWLTLNSGVGVAIYFVLIILFSFFYSYIQINPEQIAENFQKGGKFIPGVRVGEDTEKHISKVLYRINWIGAPFLAIVASIPYILTLATGIPSGMSLSGTGIIIMVTASIELWAAIKSATTTSGYVATRRNIEHSRYQEQESEKDKKVTQLW